MSVDVNGKEYGKEVQQIAAGPGTGWVSFVFKDPITGKVLPKENYVERAGDYTYLAGVYIAELSGPPACSACRAVVP